MGFPAFCFRFPFASHLSGQGNIFETFGLWSLRRKSGSVGCIRSQAHAGMARERQEGIAKSHLSVTLFVTVGMFGLPLIFLFLILHLPGLFLFAFCLLPRPTGQPRAGSHEARHTRRPYHAFRMHTRASQILLLPASCSLLVLDRHACDGVRSRALRRARLMLMLDAANCEGAVH